MHRPRQAEWDADFESARSASTITEDAHVAFSKTECAGVNENALE